jgi:endonuclease/exonuclease/phosphatase family metal-dependent hydrolase
MSTFLPTTIAAAQNIVLTPSDVTAVYGNWQKVTDTTGNLQLRSVDLGAPAVLTPLAAPQDYFEATFTAPSLTYYHVWIHLGAGSASTSSDSVWVQFSDAATPAGGSPYRINTSDALLVDLEACETCSVASAAWRDGAHWLSQDSRVMFEKSGVHTIRVQTREDGVQIDQIVLSPVGAVETKSVSSLDGARRLSPSFNPIAGFPASLPGSIKAQDFDNGGEGVSYHDSTAGNTGGAYRSTDVDIQPSSRGGNNIGWIAAGEWLNYTVDVAASGSYDVELIVASPGGGGLHVGFSGSGTWVAVPIPATGGWQNWTSVHVPVSLTAGTQLLTLAADTNGFNLSEISVHSSGGGGGGTGSGPYYGTPHPVPGSIEAEDFDRGPDGQAYHDATGGNAGGQYRSEGVDIELASERGYDVGWTDSNEWLNYSVRVSSSGNYQVHLRVASIGGASLHLGFNGAMPVWKVVSIPPTGGWQSWSTVTVPVSIAAGDQLMTILFDTGGSNLNSIDIVPDGSQPPPASPPPASGRIRMMTWNIQHGVTRSGSYDLAAQAQFIASHDPDVVALQEVETWDENQPERYRTLLQQLTGQNWTVVWAPVTNSPATEGNVILTRLPVVATATYQMHATNDWGAMYSNRSVARAKVSVNGVMLNVFSTHLDYYDPSHRTIQEEQLLSWATNFVGPRLLAGDFNSWWGEYWITRVMETYSDTWQDVTGTNQGGHTVNDAVRFDYIFRSFDGNSSATPDNCYVPATSLSDHYPVIADFTVR